MRHDVRGGPRGAVPEGAGSLYHQPEPVQRTRGQKNPVWEVLNFLIQRYLRLADTVIIPDYPPPDTVSEYNLLIPERERQHYHFTGPFLDVDLSRYIWAGNDLYQFRGRALQTPALPALQDDRRREEGSGLRCILYRCHPSRIVR